MELDLFKIDKNLCEPISEQLVNAVQRLILSGALAAGEKLPPERELAKHINVSRGTVKRAYTRLNQMRLTDVRQGSGSYVLKSAHMIEQNQKKEAAEMIGSVFLKLHEMGLSDKEIINLVNLQYLSEASRGGIRKVTLMVVSNNHDILNELEQQLSYLSFSSRFPFTLSFMTLDTIATNPDPVQMLLTYGLIIATTIDYPDIIRLAPMLKNKIIEAALTPKTKTLAALSQFPSNSRFCVIYRTEAFQSMIVKYLLSLDFDPRNIFCYMDADYKPENHFQKDVRAIVTFNESPIYKNPLFEDANSKFIKNGGRIIRFEYQIERASLVYIEDRIQKLLEKNEL